MESKVVKTQMYSCGDGTFELECPLCFGLLYIYGLDDIRCVDHSEHKFSLSQETV